MAREQTVEEQKKHIEQLCTWGGLLFIDKPIGLTSRQVDSIIKRHIGFKKVGHVGTLDPFASGELVLCLGWATSATSYIEKRDKHYLVKIHLGVATDSLDSQGKIDTEVHLNSASTAGFIQLQKLFAEQNLIEEAVRDLLNLKSQKPPIYSAIKYKGKPLYAYARAGNESEIELKERPISIKEVKLKEISWLNPKEKSALSSQQANAYFSDITAVSEDVLRYQSENPLIELTLEIVVSKGTYIRSLCEHLASKLGIGAYAASLRRLSSCLPFRYELLPLKEVLNFSVVDLALQLKSVEPFLLEDYQALILGSEAIFSLAKGQTLSLKKYEKSLEKLSQESNRDLLNSLREALARFKKNFQGVELVDSEEGEVKKATYLLYATTEEADIFLKKTMQTAPTFIGFVTCFQKKNDIFFKAERMFLHL